MNARKLSITWKLTSSLLLSLGAISVAGLFFASYKFSTMIDSNFKVIKADEEHSFALFKEAEAEKVKASTSALEHNFYTELNNRVKVLSMSFADALWNYQESFIENIVKDQLEQNRHFLAIIVYDAYGKIFLGLKLDTVEGKQSFAKISDENKPDGKALKVEGSISSNNSVVGKLEIYYNKSIVDNELKNIQKNSENAIKSRSEYTENITNKMFDIFASLRKQIIRIKLFEVFFMIFGVVILFIIISGKVIIRPMKTLVENVKQIAQGEGDLTKRVEFSSNDELGELVHWVNTFVQKLQNMIKSIVGTTVQLNDRFHKLSKNAGEIEKSSSEMGAKTGSAASFVKELSSSVVTMSTAAGEISSASQNVASAMEEMSVSVKEISKNCATESEITHNADRQTKMAKSIMNELGNATQDIGKIVNLINEIAAQTNLLALNATIEAARAGSAGKGFAVVANEVKELAIKSSSATTEIKKQIDNIQRKITSSVASIEEISTIIGEVNQIAIAIASSVEEQSVTVNEIAKNINGVSRGTNELAQNINIVSKNANSASVDIGDIDKEAQVVNKGSKMAYVDVEELFKQVKELTTVVSQFKA